MSAMNTKVRGLRGVAVIGAVALGAIAGPALAQPRGQPPPVLQPPTTTLDEKPPKLRNYFVLVLIAAGAIGACLIPSKRGHQD